MSAGIIAFFTALPAMVTLISRLGNIMADLMNYAHQNNINAWVDDLEQKVNALKNAKTQDEKFTAAQGLVDVVRNTGPK